MKKNIYKHLLPVFLFAFVLSSCDNYLDVQPKGVQVLETVEDYDEWLNSDELQKSLPYALNYLADNIDDEDISNPTESTLERLYTWEYQFSEDITTTPLLWADYYYNIYYFNTVIEGVDGATEGTEEEKASLKAEALLGRAFNYIYLVNLYGKVYDENTANEDPAVPFVTSNDLNTPTPSRGTVQEIYNHIIADLTTAITNLPADNSNNRFRGSVAAAYSLLARTYLYMGDYTKAAQNAQLALDNGPNEILDYSAMADANEIPHLIKRSDIIYARMNKSQYTFSIYPDTIFLQSFDITDLRLNFHYKNLDDYSFSTRARTMYYSYAYTGGSNYVHANWGTTVAEMRLIIAEAAARANNLTKACDELDLVRKCRFPTASYTKYESSIKEDVLQKVLAERTFEFAFNGLRWFDMRRLDAEGRMTAVTRFDGEGSLMSTLSPGSAKYTLQIPIQVLYFNPDWPQNPLN